MSSDERLREIGQRVAYLFKQVEQLEAVDAVGPGLIARLDQADAEVRDLEAELREMERLVRARLADDT